MEPSYIAVWLRKPVPALAESKPIDVIASGDYMRVAELVSGSKRLLSVGAAVVASGVQRVSVAGSWWRQAPHGGDPVVAGIPAVKWSLAGGQQVGGDLPCRRRADGMGGVVSDAR